MGSVEIAEGMSVKEAGQTQVMVSAGNPQSTLMSVAGYMEMLNFLGSMTSRTIAGTIERLLWGVLRR